MRCSNMTEQITTTHSHITRYFSVTLLALTMSQADKVQCNNRRDTTSADSNTASSDSIKQNLSFNCVLQEQTLPSIISDKVKRSMSRSTQMSLKCNPLWGTPQHIFLSSYINF